MAASSSSPSWTGSPSRNPISGQSALEEVLNSITHGLGVLFGVVVTILLEVFAARRGDPALMAACAVFGASVILLYAASALYHGVWSEVWKRRLQVLDHVAIYILIAGTYTPFALGPLRSAYGFSLLAAIWMLAALGIAREFRGSRSSDLMSVLIYLGMGWLAVLAFPSLRGAMPADSLYWLIGGGTAYTLGTTFFLWERLPFNHSIWHLFVLAGTISHFLAILSFVRPPT